MLSVQHALQPLPTFMLEPILRTALAEDLGHGIDLTTDAIVPAERRAHGKFVARQRGTIAGLDAARLAFALLCANPADLTFVQRKRDGDEVQSGETIAEVQGPARVLLTGERVALNMLGHLSGIASLTRSYVDAIHGTKARIIDTRKTLPGLRALEKYAVRCGGGGNHRFGLDDAVLIKDNHLVVAGSIHAAVTAAREHAGHTVTIEVEVDTLEQLREALAEPIDVVLLDNMSSAQLAQAVRIVRDANGGTRHTGRVLTEASGGVSLETVRAIAESGVDFISVGRLTHSAPALDLGLDFDFTSS